MATWPKPSKRGESGVEIQKPQRARVNRGRNEPMESNDYPKTSNADACIVYIAMP